MKFAKLLLICFFVSSIFYSCRKPEANFKLNKDEYSAGEMIDYTNFVQKNRNYKWEIFSSNPTIELEGKNPKLKTDLKFADGLCTLKLTTYNFLENRSVIQKEYFLVKTFRSTLRINNFNSSSPYIKNYDVYVDNQFFGKSIYYNFVADVPIGTRLITLKSSSKTLNVTATIEKNQDFYLNFKE